MYVANICLGECCPWRHESGYFCDTRTTLLKRKSLTTFQFCINIFFTAKDQELGSLLHSFAVKTRTSCVTRVWNVSFSSFKLRKRYCNSHETKVTYIRDNKDLLCYLDDTKYAVRSYSCIQYILWLKNFDTKGTRSRASFSIKKRAIPRMGIETSINNKYEVLRIQFFSMRGRSLYEIFISSLWVRAWREGMKS